MKTDCQLLGIVETHDVSTIKSAYRRLAKAVHPDAGTESQSLRNHLLFIQVTKAYERLIKQLSKADVKGNPVGSSQSTKETGVVPHKDPAYACYKTAINYFSRIHPSYWRMDVKNALQLPSPAREQEFTRIQSKTRQLASLFPKAYYYFSMVVHQYPESIWTQDARDKMRQIEERTPLYERIIESFTEHAKNVPRVNRMF